MAMRILLMGSDELACPALAMLNARDDVEVVGVVTQPDRPKGRKQRLSPCACKEVALGCGLEIFTPEKIGSPAALKTVRGLGPDLIVVAAYGQYIPANILGIPPLGAINIHPSMLPKYRGASPIQWALANGERTTGVTILFVSTELDGGDILVQEEAAIAPDDTTATLKPKLAEHGAKLLSTAIDRLRDGKADRMPQDEKSATYVRKLEKEDGRMDWSLPAETLRNRVRGFYPWPCCYTECPASSGCVLKVIAAKVTDQQGSPGEVLAIEKKGPVIGTGDGSLLLLEVQPEGKKPMSGRAYLNGHALQVGDVLG